MYVLMLFNDLKKMTVQDMLTATNIPEKDLMRTLQCLTASKQKILQQEGKGTIGNTTAFRVNDLFLSRMHRFPVRPVAGKEDQDDAHRDNIAKVDEDKKYEIEAAIVRIMKARNSMEHNQLVAEAIEQLRHRFAPSPLVIKKHIEELIDREFIARSEENRALYTYVA